MNIPAGHLRAQVLEPALDARAENLRQHALLANPTPEIDSVVEHVIELARTATPAQREHVRALLGLVRDLAASNAREGGCETRITGVVDELVTELKRAESSGLQAALGVRAIARKLSRPLEVIVSARRCDSTAFVNAVRAVDDVIRAVPAAHLTCNASLRNELGVVRYTRLVELVESRGASC